MKHIQYNGAKLTDLIKEYDENDKDLIIISPEDDPWAVDNPERIAKQRAIGPQRGDIWMITDPNDDDVLSTVVIGVITGTNDGRVQLVQASNDPRDETTDSIVVTGADAYDTLVIWPDIQYSVPMSYLGKPLKGIGAGAMDAVESMTEYDDGYIRIHCNHDADVDDDITEDAFEDMEALAHWALGHRYVNGLQRFELLDSAEKYANGEELD